MSDWNFRRGRASSVIHALVDALGNPLRLLLTPGQAHDLAGALLPHMTANLLITDRAFDADRRVLDPLAAACKSAVIPPRPNRVAPREFDRERAPPDRDFFCKLKQFRAIAPLRQNRQKFPCRHPPRRRYDLAQLTTGPSLVYQVEDATHAKCESLSLMAAFQSLSRYKGVI